jgi:diguanylate cyclase (GGDEF)-like protein
MRELPPPARLYLASVFSVAGLLTVVGVLQARPVVPDLAAAGLILVLATVVQQFQVRSPKHQTYFLTTIFFVAGAVLLSPVELVAAVVLSHLVELLHARYRWYIQAFNIANFTIAGLVARVIYTVGQPAAAAPGAGLVLRAAAAGLVFVLLNHLLTALVILWARRIPIKQAGTLSRENLGTDLALAALGALAALVWRVDPWLVPLCLAPLFLIYQSLRIPGLQEEARTDPKTGLANMKHFSEACAMEIDRASRFRRPLSVLMADLDHLREINNGRGHLAGDQVIRRVAEAIRRAVREYDLAARFGGDEFAVLMPESALADAVVVAERIRREVESLSDTGDAGQSAPVTVSVGVAHFPRDGKTAGDLLQAADRAVYQAKAFGRNRVFVFEDRLDAAPELVLVPMGVNEGLGPIRN